MAEVQTELFGALNYEAGIFHSNMTLWATENASFHVFATNRTEACHTHPRDTLAVTLWGEGAFRVPYSAPIAQRKDFQFMIPAGEVHAYGPSAESEKEGLPVLVSVLWSPPAGHYDSAGVWQWANDVTLPAKGCRTV